MATTRKFTVYLDSGEGYTRHNGCVKAATRVIALVQSLDQAAVQRALVQAIDPASVQRGA
jgi:hypothetical protein